MDAATLDYNVSVRVAGTNLPILLDVETTFRLRENALREVRGALDEAAEAAGRTLDSYEDVGALRDAAVDLKRWADVLYETTPMPDPPEDDY